MARNPQLCANNCGFYGTEENRNLCSSCYNSFLKGKLFSNFSKIDLGPSEQRCTKDCGLFGSRENHGLCSACYKNKTHVDQEPEIEETSEKFSFIEGSGSKSSSTKRVKIRCRTCSKKVGLLGFNCRCGDVFCGSHRYPEEHFCSVDLKIIGRRILAEENPLCETDKLERRV